jgi:hypothetical protein
VALLALALLAGGGWWIAGDHPRSEAAAAPVAAPEKLVPYTDPAAGFAIDHPASWRVETIDGGVLLHVGAQDAVSVKRTVLAQPVDASNLEDLRAVTDAVLAAPEAGLDVLRTTPTTLGGLPGVQYLYTFDAAGTRGAHTHWFVFSGATMYTLVCQALPDTGFGALAPAFDAVTASFRVLEP